MTTHLECIALLAAAFPHSEMKEETIRVYQEHLKDIEADDLMVVVQNYISTQQDSFIPTIGKLRSMYGDMMLAAQGHLNADEAYEQMLIDFARPRTNFGTAHPEPKYSSELIADTVGALGGFRQVERDAGGDYFKTDFKNTYNRLMQRKKQDVTTLPQIAALAKQMKLGSGDE